MAGKVSSDPNIFILPDLGEGLEEAELIAWKVAEGDTVEEHQILAEMETDKALVEVPSPRAGTIATLHGAPGEVMKVGKPLVTYAGGSGSGSPASPRPAAAHAAKASDPEEREDAGTVVGSVSSELAGMTAKDGKALAAPAVRRLARDLGVDINAIAGTGIGGRVTAKDIREAAEGKTTPRAAHTAPASPRARSASEGSSAPTAPTPDTTRRPLPTPAYQPPAYPQQMPMQPMPGMHQGMMPMPFMPPMGYMLVPMPMPYPGQYPGMYPGMGGMGASGLPASPGYSPAGAPRPVPAPAQQSGASASTPESHQAFRGVRRTIANRLRESVSTAVHFTVVDEADVSALDAHRRALAEASGVKLSFLPFVAAAVCRALSPRLGGQFGALNARVDDEAEEIVQHASVHLGIATDTDSGLMVPVIRDAHAMSVPDLARAIASTAASARDRSIPRERLMGSTFTISNVGSHAGKFATPVINYPEVAILAVGKVYDGVVVRDGQAVVAKVMPLSLACDHRVVDGATAALALAEIVRLLSTEARTLG